MTENDSYRRYLITVGITKDLPRTGSSIMDSVNQMTRVFADDFGYERVTQLDIDPATDQIEKEIREFCLKRNRNDVVTLYYTGHADEVDGTHRVWTGNTLDRFTGNLETRQLARLMLRDTPLRYALIILDTCFAGQGGAEAMLASMPSMGESDGKTLAVLTAAYPREQIVAGDFARLFKHVVEQPVPALAGNEPPFLSLGAITRLIDADPSRPGWQTVSHALLGAKSDLLPFFPNRRFRPPLHGLDWLAQLRLEQQLRAGDLQEHFLPRARGVAGPAEPGQRFVGRQAALRDLVTWLGDPDERSARVVTGGPGSGKSAVIGRLVVLSDSSWRRTVPLQDLAADTIPSEGSFATGIHARGLTTKEVLTAICAAAGVQADTPADLLREMRRGPLTVAIDAVDEALDPSGLVTGVLVPLVETGPAHGLRLLLGTRPHLLPALGMADSAVDLDDERYADPDSLFQYVLRGLEAGSPQSPYHCAAEDVVADVAKAVAEAAGHSFLVARIVSRTLLSRDQVPDPDDPLWRAGLPGTAAEAMHDDLQIRLGAEADRARDLLRPLAFAFGAGLPWEDLWAPLSSKLSEHDYTDADLVWLRENAGSYVVEAMESGHSVYRLYHAALSEYLRQGRDERQIHSVFAAFLLERVPPSRSGPDWSRADPYTLAHLATHAERAGVLDGLLLDPRYLVNAVAAGLLAALPAARDPDAELAGRAYQRAVHQLRGQPEHHRLSYLELASRITQAASLTDRIAACAPDRPWSVPWTHWPPEHPHRILDGHLGRINGVICVRSGDGNPVVASIGDDANLRIWDVMTAEPRGVYAVGRTPLVAIRAARLSRSRTVLVLLAADAVLHIWDMSTATLMQTIRLAPRWRRLARLSATDLTLRCLGTLDGQQFAIVGGRGISTSVWDLSSGRRMAVLPAGASPGAAARPPDQPDRESRESLAMSLQANGRFLHVRFHDYLGQPDRGDISLTLAGHTADVTGYDWTRLPDGHVIVVTGSRDGTVRRWDVSSIRPESGEGSEQARVALDRILSVPRDDGTPLGLTVDADAEVALWDLRTGEFLGELGNPAPEPAAIAVARPAGRGPIAVTFGIDHAMRIWNLQDANQTMTGFPADPMRWPSEAACAHLPDGTWVAVTSGHGRKAVVWDLATGRMRHVLAGHRGWAACVTCPEGRGLRPLALTGGLDNRVNVWDLRHGTRRNRFRIVPPWALLLRSSRGQAHAMRAMTLDGGKILALVATSDGLVRGLEPHRLAWGARRTAAVPAHAVGTATLSNRRAVVVTATYDGVVQVWKREAFTRHGDGSPLLCEVNLEVPVTDISATERDTVVLATPNGLTAIRFDAGLLETHSPARHADIVR